MPAWRLPARVPLGLRIFFRGAFLVLALATVALAYGVLQEEKQLGWRNYQDGFHKNEAQIAARLRHPTGQLALMNPGAGNGSSATPLRPLVLPFSAIDFDDEAKAQQAVEMAGCLVRYVDAAGHDATLCVAVGNNPVAGGFIYTVGSFVSGALVPRVVGEAGLAEAHRARVSVEMRGQTFRWIAPFEATSLPGARVRGRLTGFAEDADGQLGTRPVRDFRGWLWQDTRCADASSTEADCPRRSFFSIRLPIELFRDELYGKPHAVWPPADLDQIKVHVQMLAPGTGPAIFDSDSENATPPFALADLTPSLLPGETLRIRRQGRDVAVLKGVEDADQPSSPWLDRLIRQLPVADYDRPIEASEAIATPLGAYEITLTGDLRGVNRSLGVVATRISWFVGAMLSAIVLTWLAIEMRMIRRITQLTKRAAAVSRSVKGSDGLTHLDLGDLRGGDELGLLAGVLGELLQRVNDDVKREHIRAAQEKDQWHAVGHEIMSPLQSLMVLHGEPGDPSGRYIMRMQQAVQVLYGSASPSEAFQAATLQVQSLDLRAFLLHVAQNAPAAGVADVVFNAAAAGPVPVRADEFSLEDVLSHVLHNADRYRRPGTPIVIDLVVSASDATVTVHNRGEPISAALIDRVFEYGVSDAAESEHQQSPSAQRGQGLFVARTYMAKMGGTITAHNTADGVSLVLILQLSTIDPG
jgi:signal transduction histidine kinase